MANIFHVTYSLKSGLSTFFAHRQFTIPTKIHQNWNYKNIPAEGLKVPFQFKIAQSVLDYYEQNDPTVHQLLEEMLEQESQIVIQNNTGAIYGENKQNIYCKLPYALLRYFKKLFISTLVYDAKDIPIPETESVTFQFDTSSSPYTVSIVELKLYKPLDNPYYDYAKNCAASLSVEAIELSKYAPDEKEVKNFYPKIEMSSWKKEAELRHEELIKDKPGIYMLYDENKNHFYVGKAIKLKDRMEQHRKTANDPIPAFTHYRYSIISGEYYEFLYLIENAAIHDCAWLLDMPKATSLKPPLANMSNLNECKMVNTAERQTRKQ